MAEDIIKIEILEDGVVSVTTDKVDDVNHVSADALLEAITTMCGGNRLTKHRDVDEAHNHHHHHKHVEVR
jgi:hypothetical protein